MRTHLVGIAGGLLLSCTAVSAQQTTGSIGGRVFDPQGAAVPGATVTATSPETGFLRVEISDTEGVYRLSALPVGIYDMSVELQGFATISNKGISVDVAQTQSVDFKLKVASFADTVTVVGVPLINSTSSSVGQVVDLQRVQSLPLNGRQFANLAATVPGVGLGFHADPTKVRQYAPLINGGAGRNVNYVVDGGDNNDDTVGGLLEQFPLEAVQEFNFQTQRFKAEYGRSNGGVMNIVTKSGTNRFQGSLFELFRDKSMNALTETEKLSGVTAGTAAVKGDYRRNQFGGSFGGPIAKNKLHFFLALERTQQDTTQGMSTAVTALFPTLTGAYPLEYRENLGTGKVVANLNASQFLSIRYGRNNNSSPDSAAATRTPDNWGDITNRFDSLNVNHNWVIGHSKLNEFIFQYSDYSDRLLARSTASNQTFPNTVQTGTNLNAPQTTDQHKFQFRDDFSWHLTGHGGLGHDFKAGANFINEPRLLVTLNTGNNVLQYIHLTNAVDGPLQVVTMKQAYPLDSLPAASVANKQYGLFFQDDWRVSNRLTLNLGLRYDLVTGLAFDQSLNPNFVKIQTAARAGLLNGIVGLENFGLEPQSDRNNIQPRIGGVYDVRGNAKDIVRGGWGIYTDFGYTNSNVLSAAIDATGAKFGTSFGAQTSSGIRNPDGSFYQVGQPLSNLASQNQVPAGSQPLQGFWVDPRLQQPYQIQSNAGWSHELTSNTVLSVDYVNALGRDLNYKPRLNQLIPGTTTRRISTLLSAPLSPNNSADRPVLSRGISEYNALILSARRRLTRGIDYSVSYTLSRALSTIGAASDELNTANIQDASNPFDAPVQFGPNLTTDARHRVNMSAIVELPWGMRVAPFFLYRSALPVYLIDGRDLNLDGETTDIPARAYAVSSVDAATGKATIKDIGACTTVNCGRSSPQSQLNLRVSKIFKLGNHVNFEAIGEVYNLFNALNPVTANRTVFVPTTGAANSSLLQPQTYSGDTLQPEQRVGQIGFRLTF